MRRADIYFETFFFFLLRSVQIKLGSQKQQGVHGAAAIWHNKKYRKRRDSSQRAANTERWPLTQEKKKATRKRKKRRWATPQIRKHESNTVCTLQMVRSVLHSQPHGVTLPSIKVDCVQLHESL